MFGTNGEHPGLHKIKTCALTSCSVDYTPDGSYMTFEDGTMANIDNCRKAVYGYDQRLEVFGSAGMVKADNNFPDNHQHYSADGVHGALPLNFFLERYTASYLNEMSAFFYAVKTGEELPVSGKDGLEAMKIALAALKSVKENRPVSLKEVSWFVYIPRVLEMLKFWEMGFYLYLIK